MKTKQLTFSSICVVINIALGMIMSILSIPMVFLDTVGTIFGSVVLGPFYGALIGGCTNLVLGVLKGPNEIPYALVNIAIGIFIGYTVKKNNFTLKIALISGILLAIIAPLIGTPITILFFGGLSGTGFDFLIGFLIKSGESIFTATFIPRIISNIIDKPLSCLIVYFLIKKLPKNFINSYKNTNLN